MMVLKRNKLKWISESGNWVRWLYSEHKKTIRFLNVLDNQKVKVQQLLEESDH